MLHLFIGAGTDLFVKTKQNKKKKNVFQGGASVAVYSNCYCCPLSVHLRFFVHILGMSCPLGFPLQVFISYGPRQANLVLIVYASSEGSGEPAHPRSLARTFAARS